MPTKQIALRLDEELIAYLEARAAKEHRTLSNMIISILKEHRTLSNMIISILLDAKEIEAEPKHGRWLTEYEPDGKPYCFHCSVCDSDFSIVGNKIAYDYCPDCGAKMDLLN